jgi:hypothetical protein
MSAVVSAVQSIGNAIGKVVEKVGDAVEKVAEVVVDTAKYVAKNPEILVIAIAAPYAVAAVGGAVGASATAISLATQPITAAAITASQGGDLEDIGKAALGSFIAQPLGQAAGAQAAKVIGSGNAAQSALSSAVGGAVGSAAGAVVTGGDVGESALFGAAGSAGASLAGAGATSLGAEEGGRAAAYSADVGEALGRTAAGGDLASELIGAGVGALVKEGDIAVSQLRQPTITNATAYFPPISPEMAALTGSTIDGSPVGDVNLISGLPNAPKMFSEGDMVVPTNARTGSPYTVRNEQGEVFQARDLTYQDGTVQRIIFDPNTQQYQQQVLQQPSVRTGESALPGVEISGGQGGILANPDPDIRTGQRTTDTAKTAREILDRRAAERERGTAGAATAPSGIERQPSGPITGGRDAGGMGEGEMAGADRSVEDMTGSELLGDAIAGGERGEDVGGGGRGGRGGGGGGEGLSEAPLDLEAMTDEELLALLEDSMDFDAEDTPLIPPDDTGMTGGLDVRTTLVGKPKAYQSSISPRVVGSSPTAAIVGEKEPIFGGEENAQSDLWNTRSLRLRKALGL